MFGERARNKDFVGIGEEISTVCHATGTPVALVI